MLNLSSRTREVLPKVVLVMLTVSAYLTSFSGSYVFDDKANIADNASIRHLGAITSVLSPPAESGTGGRPVANLSFAVNYALSGFSIGSYHALNLLIHIGCVLLLFVLFTGTLESPRMDPRLRRQAATVALATAAIWAVHPIQTATVTYISQRSEELMALFYLLLIWTFVRFVQTGRRGWWVGAVAAAVAGMASKETMVTAPLVLVLYDRTFLAGSFARVFAIRWRVHASIALSWIVLAYLMGSTHLHARGVGYGLGIKSATYALMECRAVLTYLKLSVWPHPLIFDYGPVFMTQATAVWPRAVALAFLVAGTIILLARNEPVGFGLGWFFILLAPTSTIVPIIQQPIAESRMYLPLAGLLCVFIAAIFCYARTIARGFVIAAIAGATLSTGLRNRAYASEERLWDETIRADASNPRAYYALGCIFQDSGRDEEAIKEFQEAIRRAPSYTMAHIGLGLLLAKRGNYREASREYRQALKWEPDSVEAHVDLGDALSDAGAYRAAIGEFEAAVRIQPRLGKAHYDLSMALQSAGEKEKADGELRASLRLDPGIAEAHLALGSRLLEGGNVPSAVAEFQRAIALKTGYAEAYNNLGNAYLAQGKYADAARAYREALSAKPAYAAAYLNLGIALEQLQGFAEAIKTFRAALKLNDQLVEAHFDLGLALEKTGRLDEAKSEFAMALRLRPGLLSAREHLSEIAAQQALHPLR